MANTYYPMSGVEVPTLNPELNGPRNTASQMEIPGAISAFARQCYTTGGGNRVETAKELRKKLKAAEKRERAFRKAQKRVEAEGRATDRRRQVALDALERLARDGFDVASVEAAKTLLEHSSF